MHIRLISLHVKPDQIEAFKSASLINVQKTSQEPGVIRFYVMQQASDPTRFVVVEVYRSDQARKEHLKTEHFRTWRETTRSMLVDPPESIKYLPVFRAVEDLELIVGENDKTA